MGLKVPGFGLLGSSVYVFLFVPGSSRFCRVCSAVVYRGLLGFLSGIDEGLRFGLRTYGFWASALWVQGLVLRRCILGLRLPRYFQHP